MASIDEIILRSINPFDNIRSVNFWHKQPQPEPTVDSIHQEAIATIEAVLNQVARDHSTRTVILDGDGGSGKTYLLGRLKKKLNNKAFFVYIPPFPQTDSIWRHILRYTVDSLVQIPEGQKDSQLLLWLINVLSAIKERGFKDRIFKDDIFNLLRSDRQKFIKTLNKTYQQTGIYNADNFFGVLHDLTDSELYPSACDWLRGDDLSEESLKALGVTKSIATEEAARETLANFSRIAGDTQPIVLCFDQLESIALSSDGSIDLQALFNVNTKIRDEDNNFLIIISISTNTWEHNKARIDQTHKARIYQKVDLKNINLSQAESLLASRLYLLHRQAHPQPNSPIYPFTRKHLESGFPPGKTNPREVINFGKDIFQQYKQWLAKGGTWKDFKPSIDDSKPPNDLLAAFNLKWREEFTKVEQRITRIRHLSSPELIQMLKEALAALQAENIKTPLLTGAYASYSLSYQLPSKSGRLGVVWTEDPHMNTFFYIMQACKKAVEKDKSLTLYLIRAEGLGNPNNKGYQLYQEIFSGLSHRHIKPNLKSVHYLATYHNLVKDAREGDLVIGGQTLGFKKLQELTLEAKVLHDCTLLQNLGVVKPISETSTNGNREVKVKINRKTPGKVVVEPVTIPKEMLESKDFLFNLITTQHFMGRQALINKVREHFPIVKESQVEEVIKQLCQEKKIQILDPGSPPEAQLLCLVPKK